MAQRQLGRRLLSFTLVLVLAAVSVAAAEPVVARPGAPDAPADQASVQPDRLGQLDDARNGWRPASQSDGDRDVPEERVFSEDGVPRQDEAPRTPEPPSAERVREVRSQRSVRAKVFALEDGRFAQELSVAPVHYRDVAGEWRDIDTTITSTDRQGFAYANETNSFSSYFATRRDRLVRFELGDASVTLGLAADDTSPSQLPAPTVEDNRVTYADALGEGVDLVYEVTADSLKEKIVLTQPPEGADDLSFDFTLRLDGLRAVEEDDGSIAFRRGEVDGRPLLTMPAPFMVDDSEDVESAYGLASSQGVTQSLVGSGDGTDDGSASGADGDIQTLAVTADGEWLADPERQYPVVIDPTVEIEPTPTQSQDAMILSGSPDTNYDSNWRLSVGTTSSEVARSLVRFPIGEALDGVSIDSASLQLWYDQHHTSNQHDVTIEAHRADELWDESTATWNNAPQPAELGNNTATVDDGAAWQTVANGTWAPATNGGAVEGDYVYNSSGNPDETYTWFPNLTESGTYQVDVHVVEGPDRATDAQYTVDFADGSETYTVDQSASTVGGRWETLGYHEFAAGSSGSVTLRGDDDPAKVVTADAVRLVKPATQVRPAGDNGSNWHEFSVRSIVQDWVDGTEDNHGFVLKAEDESTLGQGGPRYEASVFGYGGETANRPKLVVTYGRPGVELDPPRTIRATGADLSWSEYTDPCGFCPEDDIVEYQVHRSIRQTFTPSAQTLVAPLSSATTSYADTTAEPTPAAEPTPTDDPEPFGNAYYYMVAVKTADGELIPGPTELVRLPKAGLVTRVYQSAEVADTTLSSAHPTTSVTRPFNEPWLLVGNNSATYGDTRTLIDFGDLAGIPTVAEVVDAEVKLWNSEVVGAPDNVWELHGLAQSFDRATATWNRASASTPWTTPGGDFGPEVVGQATNFANDPQRRNWDATSLVRGWLADPATNHGVLLKLADETTPATRALFASSEAREPQLTPQLVVTYLESTPESTYYAPETPPGLAAGSTAAIDVTVTNTTGGTLTAADWVLSYRWQHPDGSAVAAEQLQTPLATDLAPGSSVTLAANVSAPAEAELGGNQRAGMVLAWDMYNTTTGQWLSDGSNGAAPVADSSSSSSGPVNAVGALTQSVGVEDSTSDQVGLESFYAYAGTNTGAGSALMNNLHAGNAVWTYDAFANPSRGLSTFVRVAYNSKDTSDTVAGYGWSLQTSSVMRLGTPIDVHPMPQGETVSLTDGDGTTHQFVFDDASGEYLSPAGVNMFLQRLDQDCMTRHRDENPRAWVMTKPDRTQFYFDCQGYMSSVVDNNGNELTFTYEQRRSNNQPTKALRYITDPADRQTLTLDYYASGDSYDYIDTATWTRQSATNLTNPHIIGKVRSVTDISGRRLTFTYTDKGLLGELIDGAGLAKPKDFAFTYDMTQGTKNIKLVSVTDPREHATTLDYYSPPGDDPAFHWSTQTITDRNGGTTGFAYVDPDGAGGQVVETTVTDAETNTSLHVTDGRGRPTSSTNALDQTTALEWSTDNKVTRLTEPNNAVTTWQYDDLTGYPLEIRDAEANAGGYAGTALTYQLGLNGHIADLIVKTSPEDRMWTFGYTTEGDLASVTDPVGNTTSAEDDYTTTYSYDEWGQLLTATDANGNTTANSGFGPNGYPETITNPRTEATTFTYDERGQVTEVTDPLGSVTTQAYDTFGRPLEGSVPKDQDAGERIVTPAPVYDANDNVLEATAPNDAVSSAVYDPADQVTHTLAPRDNPGDPGDPERRTSFTYDTVGNLLTQTEPNGNVTATAGDFTTTYDYDAIYQLLSATNADGDKVSYTYDNVGNLSTVTDPRRNADPANDHWSMSYLYDLNHRTRIELDTTSKATVTDYDHDGLVVRTTDREGNATEIVSDARGNPIEVRVPFEEEGLVTTYNTTRYEYDEVGNRTRTLTPRAVAAGSDEAFVRETVYDELNRVAEEVAPYDPADARYNTPDRTIFEYDAAGRLATVSAPPSEGQTLRNETTFDYYDNAWLASSVDPWDIVTSYDYNDLGQQTIRTHTSAGGSSSRTMRWTYFPDGKLATRSDDGVPAGLEVVLVDNSDFNNVETQGGWLRGDTPPEVYGYDTHAAGAGAGDATFTWNLHIPRTGDYEVFAYQGGHGSAATNAPYEVVHADGAATVRRDQTANTGEWVSLGSYHFFEGDTHAVTLSNDADGLVFADGVKLVRDNSGDGGGSQAEQFTYGYDPNGNVVDITDASPNSRVDSYTIGYTGLNQVAQVQEHADGAVANSTSFTYDPNGAVETLTHDDDFSAYGYDVRNLVSTVTNGSAPGDPDPNVTSFTYTDREQMLTETKPNGNTVDYTYFLDGQVQSMVEDQPDGTLVASHEIDYNPNGHRVSDDASVMDADDSASYLDTVTSYGYDPRDRLMSVERAGDGAGSEAYAHDANSNVISQSVDGTSTSFNYDRNRLLTSVSGGVTASYNYDPFGRLDTVTSAGQVVQRNVYDGFDNVVESRQLTGTGQETTAYSYDPLGRTATRTTAAGTAGAETTTFNYLGTSGEVLNEEVAGEITRSYQYSPWGQRLSQIVHNADGTTEDGFYGYNLHTDVEQLTGEDGDTTTTYGYTAYGNDNGDLFTGLDAPSAGDPTDAEPYNVYRFNAKRWDPASGDYDMGFRNYSPGLNRFLTRDTYNGALADLNLGTNSFTANRYAFAAGNPISLIEDDGHIPEECARGGWDCTRTDTGGWNAEPTAVAWLNVPEQGGLVAEDELDQILPDRYWGLEGVGTSTGDEFADERRTETRYGQEVSYNEAERRLCEPSNGTRRIELCTIAARMSGEAHESHHVANDGVLPGEGPSNAQLHATWAAYLVVELQDVEAARQVLEAHENIFEDELFGPMDAARKMDLINNEVGIFIGAEILDEWSRGTFADEDGASMPPYVGLPWVKAEVSVRVFDAFRSGDLVWITQDPNMLPNE